MRAADVIHAILSSQDNANSVIINNRQAEFEKDNWDTAVLVYELACKR